VGPTRVVDGENRNDCTPGVGLQDASPRPRRRCYYYYYIHGRRSRIFHLAIRGKHVQVNADYYLRNTLNSDLRAEATEDIPRVSRSLRRVYAYRIIL